MRFDNFPMVSFIFAITASFPCLQGLMGYAHHVKGCHSTQKMRICNAARLVMW